MSKKQISLLSSFLIIGGLYNLIVFLVRTNNESSFWISYGFIMFGLVVYFVARFISTTKTNQPKTTGLSISVLTGLYLFVEFVMGTIFMFFPKASLIACLIPNAVITALMLLVLIPAMLTYYSNDN